MNKLTAEKCREEISKLNKLHKPWMNSTENLYLEALEIALPILEQQEWGDGWIEWDGGVMPVNRLVMIEPKLRTGNIISPEIASYWDWKQSGGHNDIIAYRIIPEQPTNQNGEQ